MDARGLPNSSQPSSPPHSASVIAISIPATTLLSSVSTIHLPDYVRRQLPIYVPNAQPHQSDVCGPKEQRMRMRAHPSLVLCVT
mmetsp:Transcript_62072/g.138290  ORF Transcript_62072/g.138290 Transcript_62072/m.138290 type:complete len:84 (-) Transcript_62072:142-393(-)